MTKPGLGALGAVLLLATVAATRIGGWAVVTVEDVPEYFVAGKPLVLNLVIRQHGTRPLGQLKPSVVARSGLRTARGNVWETPTTGSYRASITVPRTGDWDITIDPHFGPAKGRLLPLRAVDSSEKMQPLSVVDRGRHLFAAKGCVSCHVHRAVDVRPDISDIAPELTDRRFAPDYLARYLADPSIKAESPNMWRMPNLALRPPEIAALVAFINSERKLSSR